MKARDGGPVSTALVRSAAVGDVLHAADGAEGLKLARAEKPDMIISDLEMPNMNGIELCAAVRADPVLHAVPFFILTSRFDQASIRKGNLVGATSFLKKPITPADLKDRLMPYLRPKP